MYKNDPFSPVPVRFLPERRIPGESVPGIPSCGHKSVNSGTSAGVSWVVPQCPHSDQEVCPDNTYNCKICRVCISYFVVQRLNRNSGKDIIPERRFSFVNKPKKNYSQISRLVQYPFPHFS